MSLRICYIFTLFLFFSTPAFSDYQCNVQCLDDYFTIGKAPKVEEALKIALSLCEDYQRDKEPRPYKCFNDGYTEH